MQRRLLDSRACSLYSLEVLRRFGLLGALGLGLTGGSQSSVDSLDSLDSGLMNWGWASATISSSSIIKVLWIA